MCAGGSNSRETPAHATRKDRIHVGRNFGASRVLAARHIVKEMFFVNFLQYLEFVITRSRGTRRFPPVVRVTTWDEQRLDSLLDELHHSFVLLPSYTSRYLL